MLKEENLPHNLWPLGSFQKVKHSEDGLVRSADVKTKSAVLTRPVTKIIMLEGTS